MDKELIIRRFDLIKFRTTERVKYLSAPPGSALDPQITWSVVCAIGADLMVTDGNAVVRVPASDVLVVAAYNLSDITGKLGSLLDHGQQQTEAKTKDHNVKQQ
jgi:hypothetical protein